MSSALDAAFAAVTQDLENAKEHLSGLKDAIERYGEEQYNAGWEDGVSEAEDNEGEDE